MSLTVSRLKRLIEEAKASPEVSEEEIQDLYKALDDLNTSTHCYRENDDSKPNHGSNGGVLYVAHGPINANDLTRIKKHLSSRKPEPTTPLR